jgi:hypothetical protein
MVGPTILRTNENSVSQGDNPGEFKWLILAKMAPRHV